VALAIGVIATLPRVQNAITAEHGASDPRSVAPVTRLDLGAITRAAVWAPT